MTNTEEDYFPPSSVLNKAMHDPFDYMLGLKDGTRIRFSEADVQENTDWVHLSGGFGGDNTAQMWLRDVPLPYRLERGIDVRLDEILWVIDAPFGS